MSDQERKEFEEIERRSGEFNLRKSGGIYECQVTQFRWEFWQEAWKACSAQQAKAEPVARLLHWTGPETHMRLGTACARTYAEFPKGEGEKPGGCWREGAPLYAAPKEPTEPVWIPVSERLPDRGRVEFCSDDLRNPTDQVIGIYTGGEWFSGGHKFINVTHWKPTTPLPKEPKA